MLFNSPVFLFAFLPLVLLIVSAILRMAGRRAGVISLIAASFLFYGWDRPVLMLLLAGSIIVNWMIARYLASTGAGRRKLLVLWIGIFANLVVLGYFKYADFFAGMVGLHARGIVLPLAISFFTFQQIAFLVDTYRGQTGLTGPLNYAASVAFFPHLIAGPLIHYKKIMAQFETRFEVSLQNFWIGLPLFAIGLAKKCGIADPIASLCDPIYARAVRGPLDVISAWIAAFGYTAQLYFDFSAYSDMAIGLGFMFGIALPINFLSPYKATSAIEFWRRWHITLSKFLRDYLYIPLGGNRLGRERRYLNLMLVMLLGGLWHGAGWTFVVWGGMHGAYLVINHAWRHLVTRNISLSVQRALAPVYATVTFLAVVFAWVLFRSADVDTAMHVFTGMFGQSPFLVPNDMSSVLHPPALTWVPEGPSDEGMNAVELVASSAWIALALAIAWCLPNSMALVSYNGEVLPDASRLTTRAVTCGALLWLGLFGLLGSVPAKFIYFQF